LKGEVLDLFYHINIKVFHILLNEKNSLDGSPSFKNRGTVFQANKFHIQKKADQ